MSFNFSWAVEMYLSGAWVDVSADVRSVAPIVLSRGIDGSGITDRVAKVGTLSFALNNATSNSAATLGYYSPDNANVRTGFGLGTKTRLKIYEVLYYVDGEAIADEDGVSITDESDSVLVTDGGWCRYDTGHCKFYGKISDITPKAGALKERYVSVQCVDYMNELLTHNMTGIAVQVNKTPNQLFGTIVGNLPVAPLAISYGTDAGPFPYALHDVQDERTSGMNALQRVMQTALYWSYIKADTTYGETLVIEGRSDRSAIASTATFANSMRELTVNQKQDIIYNTIRGVGYPTQIGTTDEVLWKSRTEIPLTASQNLIVTARFIDPTGGGNRVALYPGTGVGPAANPDVDFKMSSVAGDGGNDQNANLTIAVTWYGNTAAISLTNAAGATRYVNLLQLRGHIIRLYDAAESVKTDDASKLIYGDRTLAIAFPYRSEVWWLGSLVTNLLAQYKDPRSQIDNLEFIANANDTLMTAAMACDVGSKITLSETVTGFSADDYIVSSYDLILEPGKLTCKLGNLAMPTYY